MMHGSLDGDLDVLGGRGVGRVFALLGFLRVGFNGDGRGWDAAGSLRRRLLAARLSGARH
jgi:hypothetical protein